MKDIKAHKHIVVSGDTGNALGIVRSLSQGGGKAYSHLFGRRNASAGLDQKQVFDRGVQCAFL